MAGNIQQRFFSCSCQPDVRITVRSLASNVSGNIFRCILPYIWGQCKRVMTLLWQCALNVQTDNGGTNRTESVPEKTRSRQKAENIRRKPLFSVCACWENGFKTMLKRMSARKRWRHITAVEITVNLSTATVNRLPYSAHTFCRFAVWGKEEKTEQLWKSTVAPFFRSDGITRLVEYFRLLCPTEPPRFIASFAFVVRRHSRRPQTQAGYARTPMRKHDLSPERREILLCLKARLNVPSVRDKQSVI